MRGDQLSRQCQAIRPIEAKPVALPPDLFGSPNAFDRKKSKKNSLRSLRLGERQFHAKSRSTPREIFTPLFSFLNIFLTPWHSNRKKLKRFSAIPPLRLGERQFHAKPQSMQRRLE